MPLPFDHNQQNDLQSIGVHYYLSPFSKNTLTFLSIKNYNQTWSLFEAQEMIRYVYIRVVLMSQELKHVVHMNNVVT